MKPEEFEKSIRKLVGEALNAGISARYIDGTLLFTSQDVRDHMVQQAVAQMANKIMPANTIPLRKPNGS